MARLTLAIDLNRCMNCKACNAACKEQNDVGIGYFWTWVDRKQSDKLEEDNGAPSHDFYYLPTQCQHCDIPECVTVCATGASEIWQPSPLLPVPAFFTSIATVRVLSISSRLSETDVP